MPLRTLTTMQIGGPAQEVRTATNEAEIRAAVQYARAHGIPFFVLGGGSNVIAPDAGFPGVLILNRIPGFSLQGTTLTVGAGEVWDSVVARTTAAGLSGIEALSAIPGLAGATPVQNVGAYGQEIADTFVRLTALNTDTLEIEVLSHAECEFAYRTSIFKNAHTRKHIILHITLELRTTWMEPPFYPSLERELTRRGITEYSPENIRKAVRAVRFDRLPDVTRVANTGSFFKNPIVDAEHAAALLAQYPGMPQWEMPGGRIKLAAGWLLEKAKLRGTARHGFATWHANALVIVNEHSERRSDLQRFQDELVAAVRDKFDVELVQEPEELAHFVSNSPTSA